MTREDLGKHIALRLKDKGISQNELARRCGTSKANMSRWINGKCVPDALMLREIAIALGSTPNALLGWDDI